MLHTLAKFGENNPSFHEFRKLTSLISKLVYALKIIDEAKGEFDIVVKAAYALMCVKQLNEVSESYSVLNHSSMKMVTYAIEHAFYINVHLIERPD